MRSVLLLAEYEPATGTLRVGTRFVAVPPEDVARAEALAAERNPDILPAWNPQIG